MDGGIIVGFISIAVLTIINIVMAAFSYGKLSQKVSDLSRRVNRIEARMNGRYPYTYKESE